MKVERRTDQDIFNTITNNPAAFDREVKKALLEVLLDLRAQNNEVIHLLTTLVNQRRTPGQGY